METANGNRNGNNTYGHRLTFDDFEIDPGNRMLLRRGDPVPLAGKVFDLLLSLAENPNRLLSKSELIEMIWPGAFVEEGNLARNVSTLRKALHDEGRPHRFIVTVPAKGYRFVPDVVKVDRRDTKPAATAVGADVPNDGSLSGNGAGARKWLWTIPIAALIVIAIVIFRDRYDTPNKTIRSVAVLPLRSVDGDKNYLGVGIADAVIRRINQAGQLTVRPTSSVLRYVDQQTDTLAAGRELRAEAVMEGNFQRSGDRLRVSVNLLRTIDGASLWTDHFDMPADDVFAIQDTVAKKVSERLQIHPDASEIDGTGSKYPSNTDAYEYYIKGVVALDQREYGSNALGQIRTAEDFFVKSIQADPNYASAHAQLAFAYVWTALFIEPEESKWVDLARAEIARSQEIDPNTAETHLARGLLLWSGYEGYKNDESIRELLLAKQLSPDSGHGELAAMYGHMGLEDQAERELRRAMEVDPTSLSLKELAITLPYLRADEDGWFAARKTMAANEPPAPWYYVRKGMLNEAQKALDTRLPSAPNNSDLRMQQALLLAVKGDNRGAQSRVPGIIAMVPLQARIAII